MRNKTISRFMARSDSMRFVVAVCLASALFSTVLIEARAETTTLDASTQFLWGDDWLGEGQSIIAHYMKWGYEPAGKNFSMTGYGRVWEDFTDSPVRDDGLSGKLYYLYMRYSPFENTDLKLGRQFVNFTAGSALMDGLSLDVGGLGFIGITFAEGADVRFSLDGTDSKLRDHFVALNLRLERVRAVQFGISYVRRYEDWDPVREAFGLNVRRSWGSLSPYGEVRYDRLSEAVDEAVWGLDFFPTYNLMIKGEFYQSYPVFDTTSIYSVFAVDRYREYLAQAEYNFEAPVALSGSYMRLDYADAEYANVYRAGVRLDPSKNLVLKLSVDRRTGFGGKDWGVESSGDYRVREQWTVSAGAEHDAYRRPSEEAGAEDATRYWVGGRWHLRADVSLAARFEDNINENFDHRPVGRITLDWKF